MKKLAILAVLAMVFAVLTVGSAYSAEVQQPPAVEQPMKEWISDEMPAELTKILEITPVGEVGRMTFSSKGTNEIDYGVISFITNPEHYLAALFEGKVDLSILLALTPSKDEKGNIIPDSYDSKVVAVVFYEKKMAWYQSAEVKKVFEAATRATQ